MAGKRKTMTVVSDKDISCVELLTSSCVAPQELVGLNREP